MSITLRIEVPIACFRQSRAREYAETYPVPPPATVYGMLLSMVGEMDRYKHCGTQIAIALLSKPEKSTLIRTFRRFKKKEISDPSNARPDYQELLTNVDLIVWINSEKETQQPTLRDRLQQAFEQPEQIDRFGGLCLGESRDLINSVTILDSIESMPMMQWLIRDEDGLLTLPYWVDHIGSRGTRWYRYSLQAPSNSQHSLNHAWTEIQAN
ncbi:type I-MYXAN CRISPR-associated protein Cas5/Cmx5/DevS [Cyanobacteria bacterium FACHB-63]|nr:type I-MYXAN CRISPR-associated protein Cas5/Cmx5/DevS [Cyanobacteria bacterium FACHB-63]